MQLEDNLLNYVKSLVKEIDVDFWGNGRFLVYTDRQMASNKDGRCFYQIHCVFCSFNCLVFFSFVFHAYRSY